MTIFFALIIGVVIGAAAMFLVARNNKKRFLKAMNITTQDLSDALKRK